uniref:uncharacterized protein n=1 Tax=Myxine glutinosa TaxID=7769 RepID=UPI00358DEB2A
MPQCCVPECVNRSETNQELSFYRFSAHEKQRLKWLKLIRRKDFIPTCNSRVCSWHFSNGKDGGPSRFSWNSDNTFNFPNPEPKTHVRRQKRKQLLENSVDENEDDAVQGLLVLADAAASTVNSTSSVTAGETILQIEKDMLIKENETLKKELERQKQTFSFKQIENDADKVQYYTGLPDVTTVRFLEQLLGRFELTYHSTWTVQMLALVDQLLLTLMKLRLNLGNLDLATRFNCSTATVTNIFTTVVGTLYDILHVGMMENNIPSIAKNQKCLPSCFLPFPNCRIVFDCTEVAASNTEKLDTQCPLYSQYKDRTTLKSLIGVAPNGVMTFASDLYGGSASDKAITSDCGILKQLHPGDVILADKGFTIRDILPQGVYLNIPAFVVNGQFTQEEVVNNRRISIARIHVERSIQILKLFTILDRIPYQFKKNVNKILKVCVCLTNLQPAML